MKPISAVLAATLMALSTTAGRAEPWFVESFTAERGTFYSAVQYDATEEYVLVIECHVESGEFEIWLESPFDWEPVASYPPEVSATFTIDGVDYSDVQFDYDDLLDQEGIVAVPDGQTEAFAHLLIAILEADGDASISVSYLNRQATFSAEGVDAALVELGDRCL